MRVTLLTLATLALAAAGGLALNAIGMPAGLLMGGALTVTIAAVLGFRATFPTRLRDAQFVLVGMTMGANVAPETLSLIGQWPITMAALAIELVLVVMACGFILQKLFALDRGTAYLSSFPGHLSFIVAIASAGVGEPRKIVVIQTLRVMILTLCAPVGAIFLPVGDFSGAGATGVATPQTLVVIALGSIAAGWIFSRLKVPAGYVLGSMAFATTMKLTGHFDGGLPPLLVEITFIGMAALIGSRFAGITRPELAKAAIGGLVTTGVTVSIVTATALFVSQWVDMPIGQLWLGLSPGGLESMGALGIALGYDTAFIAAHHVARLLMLTFAIPTVVFLVRGKIREV
ncbi:AbrB family transcriptional regulator [Pelagibacterium xiamenense]|uniref:AbrB family transcriptional regulator n=1 Tax=Pelagibacterium xiamenense TaxID=2901140 RepID=UPI001E327E75|nr:AbrB family transcriptional regulator [Pelagibacterium xiamenense]MCD7059175.1 AbrB family transcriptional regulator [Pelagibacterium xiamenense]